jgi:hypothetical protein
MRVTLALIVIIAGIATSGVTEAAAPAVGPARTSLSGAFYARRTAMAPSSSLDLRLKELPTKVPPRAKKLMVPDLNPLIEQLMRHSQLNAKASKLMPWVYSSCTEMLVADYEDAVTSLDAAGLHLQSAMHNLIERSNDSLEIDNSIVVAKQEIDSAEYTILFLLEMATLEL